MDRSVEATKRELEGRQSTRERDEPIVPTAIVISKSKRHEYRKARKRLKKSPREEVSRQSGISNEEGKNCLYGAERSSHLNVLDKNEESTEDDNTPPILSIPVDDPFVLEHRQSHSTASGSCSCIECSNSDQPHSSKVKPQSPIKPETRIHKRSRSSPKLLSDKDNEDVQTEDENDDVVIIEGENKNEVCAEESSNEEGSLQENNSENLPNYYPALQGCRSVEEFLCMNRIEEGTYGVVYRAKDKRTNEIVALKRLKMEKEKEGFPITSLREINTLLKGQHPNIVTVREIVFGSNLDKIFIVMDYVEHDLKTLMETMKLKKQFFFPGEVKCLLQQLLKAVAYLHDNWILHRDLKTSNLLLSHKGILKVGDFGLAREYGSPLKAYTPVVVTLWYRAPEILLCTKEYSTSIDMWSVGCIFGEFLQMGAVFPGKSEVDQLNRIFKELGTPNEKIWPGYNDLPGVKNILSQNSNFIEYPISNLKRRFYKKTSELGISLLQGLLTYDPKQRLTAEQALENLYFKELPLPVDPSMFPTWPAKSELGAQKTLVSSPKPPSGGSQFKQLERDEITTTKSNLFSSLESRVNERQLTMGPGFNLKF